MPPRIRTRAVKASKENIGVKVNSKPKNVRREPRKVLGDKTNSASDENVSVEVTIKSKETVTKVLKKQDENSARPHRDRRLPTRFVENQVLTNLSNSKDAASPILRPSVDVTPIKIDKKASKSDLSNSLLLNTSSKLESSLIANRPKRVCRLPSKFDNHLISPTKYIPIKPTDASTPIQQSKAKSINRNGKSNDDSKPIAKTRPLRSAKSAALQKKVKDNSSTDKSSPDTNNNAKGRSMRVKKTITIEPSTNKTSPVTKKLVHKNVSFKVLEDKNYNNQSNQDVYEFTFDPDEEPKPQKKKRKVVKKKPAKPKAVLFKSNYDLNINKALSTLKSIVARNKPSKAGVTVKPIAKDMIDNGPGKSIPATKTITKGSNCNVNNINIAKESSIPDTGKDSIHETNYPSIRVEDIAADIEPSIDHDINYSPVNSPCRPKTPLESHPGDISSNKTPVRLIKDPLNLQEDFSFFDDQPVASSSMNMSARHPLASPWRVEFGSLPMKWHVNTYVKPDMTPAVESSFISSSDSINRKKHVYTNMVPNTQPTEVLPEIISNTSNLKQTSIISFIKEVAERQEAKKKKAVTPIKYHSLFEDVQNLALKKQTEKGSAKRDLTFENKDTENMSNNSKENSEDKENSTEVKRETRKRKNNGLISNKPTKSPRKQKDHAKNKDLTYFGFDESENQEQENVSPLKVKNHNVRALRPRTRPALQELNTQTGPMRAALPTTKSNIASSEAINRVFEEPKTATDAPQFPEKDAAEKEITNIGDENDDSQSVHLFEDIEVVHHMKPSRKSYGKAKKVTFRQRSLSDSESSAEDVIEQNASSEEDDLADLTFEVPNIKEKKVTKKKKTKKLMSKKEEREADEWAAGFNSMCEDIDEYPLLIG